jgi:DNA (cytosine-5)-methyltransferase 1
LNEVKQIGNYETESTWDNPQTGRVYSADGISPTPNTCSGGDRQPKIVEAIIVRSTGRNPDNPSDRTPGNHVEQRLEPNSQGICNTLTSVQKDNLVLEPIGGIYISASADFQRGILKGMSRSLKTNQNDAGVVEKVKIKQATKEGYIECKLGGVADLSYPTSKTRRGRVQDNGDTCPTLTASETGICRIETPYRIRKLTPRECWRLMDFTDEDYEKAEAVNSNTQLYKQAGNSIVKAVLIAIFKQMLQEGP